MLKYANFALVLGTLVTASVLYNLEHETRSNERTIAKSKAEMIDNVEAIKLLKAEWSSLTRPERLQRLAEQHLGMTHLQPDQIVTAQELPQRLQDLVKAEGAASQGTIDDILKKMQ